MIQSLNYLLATGTLLLHIALLIGLSLYLYTRFSGKKVRFYTDSLKFINRNNYTLAFIVSLVSVMTSLFWSEIMQFTPCILCWYQRIFMYPQVIMHYIALARNEKVLSPYLVVINAFGLVVALYHHMMQLMPKNLALPCKAIGGVSCIEGYSFYYGYITFPLMSTTAFLILLLLHLKNKSVK